jgi:hypothetical protein
MWYGRSRQRSVGATCEKAMSGALLLKVTLAPLLVAAATLVANRWGPGVGGLLMGLPLTTGPIFLLLTIDHGTHFGFGATLGILCGLVGLAAFAVVYTAVSAWKGCIASLSLATVAFFAVSAGIRRPGSDLLIAAVAAWFAQLVALAVIRRPGLEVARANAPWWDLWARMFAVAVLTLAVTTMAAKLGPELSGIVGTFPVAITVVVAFTHQQSGRDGAVGMLRGCVLSWISFASCFVMIGLSIESLGTGLAIALGLLAAMATSAMVLGSKHLWDTSSSVGRI